MLASTASIDKNFRRCIGRHRPSKNCAAGRERSADGTMSAFYQERVIGVQHWTDTLFSFSTTRNPGFRFQNGQFTMMGLEVDGRPLLRAYSMASANHEEALE